jgi:prepilin-type N-terminal cleavage/methylation domain-containing protein
MMHASKKRFSWQAGYTLFELIVAVGIIAIVFGLAAASYNLFNKRERVRQAGITLKSNLRFAQTKALSGEKPQTGCDIFLGMYVSFATDGYTIGHTCSNGVSGELLVGTLPSEVVFSPVPASFTFLSTTRRTDLSSDRTITVTNGLNDYQIVVGISGDISDVQ